MLGKAIPKSAGDTIYETSYRPNRLTYKARTARGGVAVFSEIYFPWGWEATVDGKPAQIGRVNYVLRALRLEPGQHDITFTFDPKSLRVTNNISVASVILIYIIALAAAAIWIVRIFCPDLFPSRRKKREEKEEKEREKTEKKRVE